MALKIGYWSIRGLGAPLRMMAEYAGVEYEATMYNVTEKDGGFDRSVWLGEPKAKLKAMNPLINLPYVIDGDRVITQSNACMTFLADRLNINPSNPGDRIDCEQLLCQAMDLRNAMVGKFYNPGTTPDQLKSLLDDGSIAKFEMWLEHRGDTFLLGKSPVAPDFHLFELLDQLKLVADVHGAEWLEGCTSLKKYYSDFRALPEMESYFSSRMHGLPLNNKMAVFGSAPGGARYVMGQDVDWDSSSFVRTATASAATPAAPAPVPGKEAWPELVGQPGASAKLVVEAQGAGEIAKVELVPEGTMVTMDVRQDRVRIHLDAAGNVAHAARG